MIRGSCINRNLIHKFFYFRAHNLYKKTVIAEVKREGGKSRSLIRKIKVVRRNFTPVNDFFNL